MKIIFFGSDDFAATSLEKLMTEGYEISAIVTQPDRARGRGMKMTLLPVKMIALEHLLPLFQPERLDDPDFQKELAAFSADVFVVIAYGQFLPSVVLDMPKKYSINVHASLLPKYRGAAPINWVLINGETKTGVTVIRMNEQMDAGEMLKQKAVDVSGEIDAVELREQLANLGAVSLIETLRDIDSGKENLQPQDEQEVTFAPKLSRELGKIDWNQPALKIHNLVRGLVPWPCAETIFKGKKLKVLETQVLEEKTSDLPGVVTKLIPQGIAVACGQGTLLIKKVHLESSKPMNASSFSVGYRIKAGTVFGGEK